MNTTSQCHSKVLKRMPFFASLNDDDLYILERIIHEKKFRKNSVILLEEETKDFMYIVFSGKVKVVQASQEGKDQILAIHNRGNSFGEMALLDGKTQPASVIAMEDTTVGLIAKTDFEHYLLNKDSVVRQIISLLCKRLRESWLMLRVIGFADAESRVRAVLTHISSVYGINDLRGTMIPLRLTHKEIAEYAALTRETVSRLLSRLMRSGEIEIMENRNIIIKPNFTKKISCQRPQA